MLPVWSKVQNILFEHCCYADVTCMSHSKLVRAISVLTVCCETVSIYKHIEMYYYWQEISYGRLSHRQSTVKTRNSLRSIRMDEFENIHFFNGHQLNSLEKSLFLSILIYTNWRRALSSLDQIYNNKQFSRPPAYHLSTQQKEPLFNCLELSSVPWVPV